MYSYLESILSKYPVITLNDMKEVKLMNRTDTKFITTCSVLMNILWQARNDYMIQNVNCCLNSSYSTTYYDTDDCSMFMDHHNGKSTRHKIRIRSYIGSNLMFLEIKSKNNKGRTDKKRIEIDCPGITSNYEKDFIAANSPYPPLMLRKRLVNRFNRITLVNIEKTERVTIDTNIQFYNSCTEKECKLNNLVIIELKRDSECYSSVMKILNDNRVHPSGFSKYCIGSAITNPDLKQNRFKMKLHYINKLLTQI